MAILEHSRVTCASWPGGKLSHAFRAADCCQLGRAYRHHRGTNSGRKATAARRQPTRHAHITPSYLSRPSERCLPMPHHSEQSQSQCMAFQVHHKGRAGLQPGRVQACEGAPAQWTLGACTGCRPAEPSASRPAPGEPPAPGGCPQSHSPGTLPPPAALPPPIACLAWPAWPIISWLPCRRLVACA